MAIPASAAPATAATIFQSAIKLFNVQTLSHFDYGRARHVPQQIAGALRARPSGNPKRTYFNQLLPPN